MVEAWIIGLVGYVILLVIIVVTVQKLTQHSYKNEWVASGREWRDKGWSRFNARHKWIQRYFDMGYDEKK